LTSPADFEYLTITGMINRLRQYILDRELTDVCLIGSSMGGLVGLNYAHRYGGVAHLLLLSPALTYLSGERVGLSLAEWQADGVGELFHYGFNRPVRLRYDLEVDGRFYQTPPPPPAPITIIHGTEDEVVPIAASRDYAQAYPDQVQLIEVTAGHDINAHLPLSGRRSNKSAWLTDAIRQQPADTAVFPNRIYASKRPIVVLWLWGIIWPTGRAGG
jgi:uncharacterized protein